jgi:hypothetical protein
MDEHEKSRITIAVRLLPREYDALYLRARSQRRSISAEIRAQLGLCVLPHGGTRVSSAAKESDTIRCSK